jgi:hypothetical protein
MINHLKRLYWVLASFFLSKVTKLSRILFRNSLNDFQRLEVWRNSCENILSKPYPPLASDFSDHDLVALGNMSVSKFSNWEIVCQEILDTQLPHTYYQRCYDELRKRGKSEQEIFEMRRFAWLTAGWLNFPMMVWDWAHLSEKDILMAIEWLYDYKQISRKQRVEFENFVKLHES